jgi:hypothetical protein
MSFSVGEYVIAASSANPANYMSGQITAYTGTSMTVNVTVVGGSGTHTDWNILLSGAQGTTGATGPAGPGVTWVDVNSASVTAVPNTGYMANSGSSVTIQLPVSSAMTVGDVIQVNGVGTGGWKINRNALQSIIINGISTNSSVTGVISGSQYAAIELQYIGNNIWTVLNYTGNVGVLFTNGEVYEGGLTWMWPVNNGGSGYAQAAAVTFCAAWINDSTGTSVPGWRLPTEPELKALYATYPNNSAVLNVQGWVNGSVWSSTLDGAGNHDYVTLSNGSVGAFVDATALAVTCVR